MNCSQVITRVVLQLCGAVGWYAERTCGDSTNDLQMAAKRARYHSVRRALVPSIFVVLTRCRRALGGARLGSRSHHGMALGAALWTRTPATVPASPQAHQ